MSAQDLRRAAVYHILGQACARAGDWQGVLHYWHLVTLHDPHFLCRLLEKGYQAYDQGEFALALRFFHLAIQLAPDHTGARSTLGTLRLLHGDYGAWEIEEDPLITAQEDHGPHPLSRLPRWTGDAFVGQRLLVWGASYYGAGDVLFFVRLAAEVQHRGGVVILECPPALARLHFSGVVTIATHLDPTMGALQCPISALPALLQLTETSPTVTFPYCRVAPSLVDSWAPRLTTVPGKTVGLCWAGNPHVADDHWRSCQLHDFAPLATVPGVSFVSVQKGAAAAQAQSPPARMTLFDWTTDLHDFADTAALLLQLDLLITTDTAVCHLAGALGLPVWVVVPYTPNWRWQLGRTDCPWYPSMRLFRMPRSGDRYAAIANVREALMAWATDEEQRKERTL